MLEFFSEMYPERNNAATVDSSCRAVNHKVTVVVKGSYFARMILTVLRSFLDVPDTIKHAKSCLKIEYLTFYDTVKYGHKAVAIKMTKYD